MQTDFRGFVEPDVRRADRLGQEARQRFVADDLMLGNMDDRLVDDVEALRVQRLLQTVDDQLVAMAFLDLLLHQLAGDFREQPQGADVAVVQSGIGGHGEATKRAVELAIAEADGHAQMGADRQRGRHRQGQGLWVLLGIPDQFRQTAIHHALAIAFFQWIRVADIDDGADVLCGIDITEDPTATLELGDERDLHPKQCPHRMQRIPDTFVGRAMVDRHACPRYADAVIQLSIDAAVLKYIKGSLNPWGRQLSRNPR